MESSKVVHRTSIAERIAYHTDRYLKHIAEGKRHKALREGNALMVLLGRHQLELQQMSIDDLNRRRK